MKIERYEALKKQGIVNGCGAKGGFSFDKFFETRIKLFDKHNQTLFKSLEMSIQLKCCGPHDVRFYNGGGIKSFIKANYIFSKTLFSILDWTNVGNRIFAFTITFIGLNIGGIKAFNWTKTPLNIKPF